MNIDATFFNITFTHNIGKVTRYEIHTQKQYVYIFIQLDKFPELACYRTHAKINPKFNGVVEALRTPNTVFEKGLFV